MELVENVPLAIVVLIVGIIILSIFFPDYDQFCIPCQEAKAHCPNGYRINEDCTKGIYGYKCTNDGLNITYTCIRS